MGYFVYFIYLNSDNTVKNSKGGFDLDISLSCLALQYLGWPIFFSTGPPTPFYNSCILEDIVSATSEATLTEAVSGSTGVKEGIILLKVWLRQRQLDTVSEAVGCFVIVLKYF